MRSYDRRVSEPEAEGRIRVPFELEGGTYANFLSAWHTADEFTLDFCVSLPPDPAADAEFRLVARLKIPVTMVFEFLRNWVSA